VQERKSIRYVANHYTTECDSNKDSEPLKKAGKASMLNNIKSLASCLKMQLMPNEALPHNEQKTLIEQQKRSKVIQEAIAPHQIK